MSQSREPPPSPPPQSSTVPASEPVHSLTVRPNMLQEHVQPNIGTTAPSEDAAAEVEQALQRESYHETERPLVEELAVDAREVAP